MIKPINTECKINWYQLTVRDYKGDNLYNTSGLQPECDIAVSESAKRRNNELLLEKFALHYCI